jgi:hypothetical protein
MRVLGLGLSDTVTVRRSQDANPRQHRWAAVIRDQKLVPPLAFGMMWVALFAQHDHLAAHCSAIGSWNSSANLRAWAIASVGDYELHLDFNRAVSVRACLTRVFAT